MTFGAVGTASPLDDGRSGATTAETAPVRKRHASADTLERGRLRRIEIIDAAAELFASAGYRGTGLAGIAAQVGVTQAGLLHHFRTKEHLLEAVIRHRSERDAPLIREIVGEGGLEMLDRLALLAEHNTSQAGLAQLFTVLVAENLLPDHPEHDFFVKRYRTLADSIAQALRRGQERGEIRGDLDLKAVARRIIAALDGLQSQWLLDPEEVDLVDAYRELGASLKEELRSVGSRSRKRS
jgi:AcrR family transcriptional regulator